MASRKPLVFDANGRLSEMPSGDVLPWVTLPSSATGAVATTGGTTTLSEAQYAAGTIYVTGALTSNAVLVVPAAGAWSVFNRTSGAFTTTVKTASGTGIVVAQNASVDLAADGTNVVVIGTDYAAQGLLPSVSPAMTGTPTAPTAAVGTSSTQVATTAMVQAAKAPVAVSTTGGSTTLTAAQYGGGALVVSGALASAATLVVPNSGMWNVANNTSGGFTLTVKTASGTGIVCAQGKTVDLVADGTNVVVIGTDFTAQGLLPSVSPAMTGTPTAPTATAGTSSTQVATCAYAQTLANGITSKTTTGGTTTLTTAEAGVATIVVSGTLTSAATIVFPTTGNWQISNRTTGAFTLTAKTSAGTGVIVTQGTTSLIVADGTNVVWGSVEPLALGAGWDQGAIVAAGTVILARKMPFAGTIRSLDAEVGSVASTSFTVAVQIDGVSVTGLSAVAVSSATSSNTAATAANTFSAGSKITLVISSVTGSPSGANLQVNFTR